MTNEEIRTYLLKHAENEFQKFTSSLLPGTEGILGVRVPEIRKLARKIAADDWRTYLSDAQDDSYEEIMLQGFVLGYADAGIGELLERTAIFIPKIDNWSVNDGFCSTFKIARKHRKRVWDFLMQYKKSPHEFEQRVTAVMLMDHFLVEEYIDRVLLVWEELQHEGYYCKMGVAWGIATAYATFPEKTHAFLDENRLDDFTYNKAIRKMLESYRITPEQKAVLRTMIRK